MSVLGISTGSLVHTMLSAFGLSVIIGQSIVVFNIVKYAGVAYLVYMGLRMWQDKGGLKLAPNQDFKETVFKKIYRDAVFTNVLNPKVAMFFIAFLPQFIDTAYRHTILPFLMLGITFTITGTIWCIVLAIFSSSIFSKLRKNQQFSTYLNKACGVVLIGLGIKVAMTNNR